jgi:hypothetical protein
MIHKKCSLKIKTNSYLKLDLEEHKSSSSASKKSITPKIDLSNRKQGKSKILI